MQDEISEIYLNLQDKTLIFCSKKTTRNWSLYDRFILMEIVFFMWIFGDYLCFLRHRMLG
jgi:hypothetical protein